MAKVLVEKDVPSAIKRLVNIIQDSANDAISSDDVFKIGLSAVFLLAKVSDKIQVLTQAFGGSLINYLAEGLPTITTDWTKWRFFFCDERVVPFNNKESTYGVYKMHLMGKIPITEEQFIKINPDLSAEAAAKDYIKQMSVYFPPDSIPKFDVLLLGLGPDGHTCSLFPNHRLLEETSVWVSSLNDSPKIPPSRITLTFPVINSAKVCIFTITGEAKADIIKRILKDKENLPAARVQLSNGELYWILDEAAAKHVKPT